MEYIDNIRNNISDIISGSTHKLTNLTDTKILEIGKSINSISSDIKLNDSLLIPSLVVVGSQSSGKSSVLNGILSMDILPTGKSMVTRTPLHIELQQSMNNGIIEFGYYSNIGCFQRLRLALLVARACLAILFACICWYLLLLGFVDKPAILALRNVSRVPRPSPGAALAIANERQTFAEAGAQFLPRARRTGGRWPLPPTDSLS